MSADGSENGLSIGGSRPVLAPRPDRVAAPTPGTEPVKGQNSEDIHEALPAL